MDPLLYQFGRVTAALQHPDWLERLQACKDVPTLDLYKDRCADQLVKLTLQDGDAEVRTAAAEALRALSKKAASEKASELVTVLGDECRNLRRAAVEALSTLGLPAASPHRGAILDRLNDKASIVRRAAALAVGTLGVGTEAETKTAIKQLLDSMQRDREAEVRRCAAVALGRLLAGASGGSRDDAIAEVLTDAAAQLIDRMGGDPYASVRAAAAAAMGSLGPDFGCGQAHLILTSALRDPSWDVRHAAAKTLAALGSPLARQIALALASAEHDEQTRLAAAEALGAAGLGAVPYSEKLAAALGEKNQDLRIAAVEALTAAGCPATIKHSQQLLGIALKDEVEETQSAALQALVTLQGTEAAASFVKDLLDAMTGKDSHTRWGGIQGLRAFGPAAAAPHAGKFAAALSDTSWYVRHAAASMLGELGPAATPYLEDLLTVALRDLDWDVRRAAIAALGAQGQAASCHSETIAEVMTGDKNVKVRIAAIQALARLGIEAATPHLPRVMEALRAGDHRLRIVAANAIAVLGPAVRDTFFHELDYMVVADNVEEVQEAAKRALAALDA